MELAIPLIALGGMYIISNNNSQSQQRQRRQMQQQQQIQQIQQQVQSSGLNQGTTEGFQSAGRNPNYLPNTNIPPQNYPVPNENEVVDVVSKYVNPNVATDKYFNQNYYENEENKGVNVGNNIQEVYSLTGDYVDKSNFKHNNMVPFYGGKMKGQVYGIDMAETILDNMVGSGSQTIQKIEQAPLFKPEDNVQWAYGAPNNSDFYQSRVNPGMKASNIKPFETQNVGPGLGLGYTTEGEAGYNSGMLDRDAWLPKTVDELRVDTNPKLEYTLQGHQGPSYAYVQNVGIEGKVEKYRPDTFYIQNQDRWLTTTGQEKGQALRPVQEVYNTSRNVTTRSYTGVAAPSEKIANYIPGAYEDPKREETKGIDAGPSNACGKGTHEYLDNALQSHTNYTNNRALLRQPDTMRSSFSAAIGSVVAPLMDFFKPTRKEEYSSNMRIYGDAGSEVSRSYVNNPLDVAPTTIKQTTMYTPNIFVGGQVQQGAGGYKVSEQQAIYNQRDTTNVGNYGVAGGASRGWGDRSTTAEYNQHNNDIKEEAISNSGRTNTGNMNLLNHDMNICVGKNVVECNPQPYGNVAPVLVSLPMGASQYGIQQSKQQYDEVGITRISPDLLSAFKSNPYVQSLHSY
jgi:hypothetical protein